MCKGTSCPNLDYAPDPITPQVNETVLLIPVGDVIKLSSAPLKWLRYAAGTVLGVEGTLNSDVDGNLQEIDYQDPAPIAVIFSTYPQVPLNPLIQVN